MSDPSSSSPASATPADLLITGATLVATCDDERREIPGGWVAITDGVVSGVGPAGSEPAGRPGTCGPTAAW